MSHRDSLGRSLAALLAGGALGVSLETGAALLLYTGLGALSAAGFITGVALAALAAGIWVGEPEDQAGDDGVAPSAGRWLVATTALVFAAMYAAVWEHAPRLRALPLGRALAVLLMVAWPAYSLGALIGTLDARARHAGALAEGPDAVGRERTGIATAALFGAAIGFAWGGLVLIPRLPAGYILGGAAAVVVLTGAWEARQRPRVLE